MAAARAGKAEMFSKLIAFSEGTDEFATQCEAALGIAIPYGLIELAKAVVEIGVHLEFTHIPISNFSGVICRMPALHAAAYLDQVDLLRLLLDHGLGPYMKDQGGLTPLWAATFYGVTEAMQVLLKFGVRADGRDQNGQGHEAIAGNLFSSMFREKLNDYLNPMHFVPGGPMRLNCCKPLCVAACNWRFATPSGCTERQPAVVELLIERGARLETKDLHGRMPLDLALRNGTPQVVKFLINKGANIHSIEAEGCDPILRALECGHLHSYRSTTSFDVHLEEFDVFIENNLPPPVITAILPSSRVSSETEHIRMRRGYYRHLRIDHDCEQAVECFLERGSNVNSRDKLGRTLLHYAAFYDCINTVQLLLKKGASPNVRDAFDQTPLHVAFFRNTPFRSKKTTSEILLEAGADPNLKDNNRETFLHAAARVNFHQGMNALINDSSVDFGARDDEGNTALHLAVKAADSISNDKFDIIMALCKAGSNPHIENYYGDSVWGMATAYSLFAASWLLECVSEAGFYSLFSDRPCDKSWIDSRRTRRRIDYYSSIGL
ncbi:hypothetical protein N7540_004883 [Penicillium herquei]|nr:hypothetical protein N7540_004883 [Penicillium herquei]